MEDYNDYRIDNVTSSSLPPLSVPLPLVRGVVCR